MFRDCLSRFWGKVDVRGDDECWEWQGTRVGKGYGTLTMGVGRRVAAHRFSWEIAHAEQIPPGKFVLHSCDNPPCVNPRHLRVGTVQDNTDDMISRKRHMHGDRHVHARLTSARVWDLVSEYRSGVRPRRLAEKYGVHEQSVHDIINGVTWVEVTGGPVREDGRSWASLTPAERDRIVQLRREGMTQTAIAETVNRSVSAVRETIYAAGLAQPRVGRPRKISITKG